MRTLVKASLIACLLISTGTAQAEKPKPEDEARALLLLAKAKRERLEAKAVAEARACLADPDEAAAVGKRTGKPVVYWVGMHCDEAPEVRSKLSAAINCHAKEWNGSAAPRVVITAADGSGTFSFAKDDLTPAAAEAIKKMIGLP